MEAANKELEPNRLLRREREMRGWSQRRVADEIGTNVDTVSKWERGINIPDPHFREKLCALFGRNAVELGFLEEVKEEVKTAEADSISSMDVWQVEGEKALISEAALSDFSVIVLHTEQATAFLKLLKEIAMAFDPQKRETFKKMLRYLVAGAGAASATSSIVDLFDSETEDRLSQSALDPSMIDEKTLIKFEKVTENSWLLLRYDGLPTVEQLLPTYLQRFALFAQKPSRYQERAASIVAQGYILQGLVAVLNSDPAGSEKFCEQAVFYARLAKDRNLEAAALKHLATKFLDNGHPLRTLQKYQEVLPFVKDISPLLQGRTYLGLALAYARTNQEREALYHLDMAHDSFPENPENDLSFSYADCHTSSLYHYGGLIHTEFARFEKAHDIFAQVEELPTKSTVPERTRIEIINCQAGASLALRDLRSSRDLIERSIRGALKLKSEKRYNDALALYKQARLLWPQESQVKELADLFIR